MTGAIDMILPSEDWGDAISLGVWAFTFLLIFVAIILNSRKNLVRFDGLSVLLLSKTFVLFVLFGTAAIGAFYPDLRPAWFRWTLRSLGITIGFLLFFAIINDTYPDARLLQWLRRKRLYRWLNARNPWRLNK
jgi:hypothetical protein